MAQVEIYTKGFCSYCFGAKRLLAISTVLTVLTLGGLVVAGLTVGLTQ